MRERIWTELTQAKFNVEFTALYSERQRALLRYFNIGVLSFSTAGVMGWPIWDELPVIACVIIAAVSLLRLLQPHLVMSDKLLNSLDRIHRYYTEFSNNLEKLWYDLESDRITEKQATDKFYKLKQTETEINSLISDTIRYKPKRLVEKAKSHSDQYFKLALNTSA